MKYQAESHSENFPVASWLIPAKGRHAIHAFYDFARGADNIADDPQLPGDERARQLEALRAAMAKREAAALPDWALAYAQRVWRDGFPPEHGDALLEAFLLDCHKTRYANWLELVDYCRYSAAPVGRAVLAACAETQADLAAADQLCMALQIINHLQDVKEDYRERNRIYLPQQWWQGMAEDAFAGDATPPPMCTAINQALDGVDRMLSDAARLPATLHSQRLRLELRVIRQLALRLAQRLRQEDPLAKKIKLGKMEKLFAIAAALRESL